MDQGNVSDYTGCHNLSNLTQQGTREMWRIAQDVRTCLIWHNNGPGKCVGLHRMSEYSDSILVNRNTLGPYIFFGCRKTQVSDCTTSTVYAYILYILQPGIWMSREVALYPTKYSKSFDLFSIQVEQYYFHISICNVHGVMNRSWRKWIHGFFYTLIPPTEWLVHMPTLVLILRELYL